MDLITLFIVYAAILLACAGALVITWRQNPRELGPKSWAIGSVLAAGGLLVFAATAKSPSLIWINCVGVLLAVAGSMYYARGSRQYVGERIASPRWYGAAYGLATLVMALAIAFTPYRKGLMIGVASALIAAYCFDNVLTLLRRRETRSAPSYFLAFFFLLFGGTNLVRGVMTLLDPGREYYERTIEHVLIFVGIVGGAASAMGFAMLTTARVLAVRKRDLDQLQAAVADLRQQLEGLARGDYAVRAKQLGTSGPMDALAALFNQTAEQVGAAFAEIERQRSLLEATLESMLDGLLLLDTSCVVQRVNPSFAALIGLAPERLIGRPLAAITGPAERAFLQELVERVASGPLRERPTQFRTDAGDLLRLTVNASAQRSDAGEILGVVLAVRDERDLEEARAQLHTADRLAAMGLMAAGVAHEINNPLAFVVTNLDFALEELRATDGALSPADVAELVNALESAHRGAERVRQIVKDLKTLSRSEDEPSKRVDVNALVGSAVAMLRNELRHHARLELELGAVSPVDADEAKLGQVFLNLLHNAAQAIPPGRAEHNAIRVTSGVDTDGHVFVALQDSGEGIAPEHMKRIFDAFFTTKPVGVGTGLGLSICHRVVTALGGRIEVESELGRGSTFRVLLPAATAAFTESAPAAEPPAPIHERRRVLVVDDEIEVGHSIRRILGRTHAVEIVASGSQALAAALRAEFDVILCDVMMPEMTGMQLHAELTAQAPALAARMVFLSGGVFSAEASEFLRSFPDRVLYKPFKAEALRRMVEEAWLHEVPAAAGR